MIILGIDPGSRLMGYGIIEKEGTKLTYLHSGTIDVNDRAMSQKLEEIYSTISKVIEEYKPDLLSIENIFYAKNVQSTIKLAHARAIPILLAQINKIPVYQFTPLEVKQSVVGYGRAEKHQIQEMVKILLKLEKKVQADASDALALAITCSTTASFDKEKHRT